MQIGIQRVIFSNLEPGKKKNKKLELKHVGVELQTESDEMQPSNTLATTANEFRNFSTKFSGPLTANLRT